MFLWLVIIFWFILKCKIRKKKKDLIREMVGCVSWILMLRVEMEIENNKKRKEESMIGVVIVFVKKKEVYWKSLESEKNINWKL